MRFSSFILLFVGLLLPVVSGCGESGNAEADPEYQRLQKEYEEKLKTDPVLQKQAEEKKRREI